MTHHRKVFLGIWIALFLLGTLLFQESLDHPFIFDDIAKIRDNPDLRIPEFSLENFIHNYSEKKIEYRNDPSRPLTFITYWALWHLGSGSVVPFHVLSILLHIFCALFVGTIASKLVFKVKGEENYWAAAIASLFFLIVPINTGTVVYAYGLSDVLSTFFALALVCLLILKSAPGWTTYLIALLLYGSAIFSKQSALVLPAIVFMTDFFQGSLAFLKRRWRLHLILFLVAGFYLAWRILYFGKIGDLEAYDTYDISIYAPLQGIMIWQYLVRVWVPWNLTIDQSFTPSMFEYWHCWLSWGAILAVSSIALIWGRKTPTGRLLSIGWFFYLFALLPTSSLFPTTDLMVERRAYLPSAGLFIAFGSGLGILIKRMNAKSIQKKSLIIFVIALLSMNFLVAKERIEIYGDEELLWKEAIRLFPQNERPRVNLINYYLKHEKFILAEKELNELLQMYPDHFQAVINVGIFYQHPRNPKRDIRKALEAYQKVLAQEPQDLTALLNTGALLLELNQPQEASKMYEQILKLNANFLRARLGLLESALRMNDPVLAQEQARAVLALDPENHKARSILNRK